MNHPLKQGKNTVHKLLFGGVAAAAIGLSACGGTTHSPAAAPPDHAAAPAQTPYAAPTTAPATPSVLVESSSKGMYLTDASGRALYVFTADHGSLSACTGSCAIHWPAFASRSPVGGPGVQAGALGTANGQVPNQVTYDGRLLYYYAGDRSAGTTNGLSIPGWLLIAPDGTPFGAPAPTAPAAAPVTQPARVPATHPAPPATTPVMPNPIPQGGGGDGDGDNSGGSSDGDGNV
ncbi:MAG TPA: hypothetical protein VKV36_03745 [Acidimicrobiales bacterium]|nr:hypothetical protein [Acidimicrobiales bacterium]